MGVILSAKALTHRFDSRPLFRNLHFGASEGERLGLIGPNGAGKSTLLRILASQFEPMEGEVIFSRGLRVRYLDQVPTFSAEATVQSTLLESASEMEDWEASLKADELLWKLDLNRMGLTRESKIDSLSGGWKKRVAIARELMAEPDLLLMDEPTNHLDIEGILWLENLIRTSKFATITITHDRAFLQAIATRILEIDRRYPDGLLSIEGDYAKFLETKAALLEAQENRETILRGNLRRETEWIKAGAKARTTKQQARIHRHGELAAEVKELSQRNVKRTVQMEFQSAENQPKRLLEAKKISKKYGDSFPLFSSLDVLLTPGKRIGIIGDNGAGKSTLIRVLLGEEDADGGKIFRSDSLKVAYFEQGREKLDPEVSLLRTICPYGDQVIFQGRTVHVRSYLERFLFSQSQLDQNVGSLSGGEQSRALMAKLMLTEANLLVLDEPTNDLDIPTLNFLEECLKEFEGAILMVSHDRYFLDQVSTEILAFPVTPEARKKGELHTFADLSQWTYWHEEEREKMEAVASQTGSAKSAVAPPPSPKLRANDSKEVQNLTKKIDRAEKEMAELEAECSKPEIASDLEKLTKLGIKMKTLQAEIDQLYARWEMLE